MPADPTDALARLRARADTMWPVARDRYLADLDAVLADERERARAPFLALADDLARHTVEPTADVDNAFIRGLDLAAGRIRTAAQEDPK